MAHGQQCQCQCALGAPDDDGIWSVFAPEGTAFGLNCVTRLNDECVDVIMWLRTNGADLPI